ncbi:MAG: glycosyltransferase family 2 protein [Planctomycetota bacterium]|nr:glycosyltransferase family 2 protein [Planctomycetota bacterium]
MRVLVAIPVYNEAATVRSVLSRVLRHAGNVLVVDDGSTDDTTRLLVDFPVDSIRHAVNRGYGRSLIDAFRFAADDGYDWVITMDCDEQHEPESIPDFLDAAARADKALRHAGDSFAREHGADIISGTRYAGLEPLGQEAPADRRTINATITSELNHRLGLRLTDAFCGFKAYRVSALRKLALTENGYAFPMQFWVQAVARGLTIKEIPVRRIYMDLSRTFGDGLDNPAVRLAHYRDVMHREIVRSREHLPAQAALGLAPGVSALPR